MTSRQHSAVLVIPWRSSRTGPSPAAWNPTTWPWSSTSWYSPMESLITGWPLCSSSGRATTSIDSLITTSLPRIGLLDVHAGDGARDHQALDLRGSLEDRPDLGVSVHPLDGEFPR